MKTFEYYNGYSMLVLDVGDETLPATLESLALIQKANEQLHIHMGTKEREVQAKCDRYEAALTKWLYLYDHRAMTGAGLDEVVDMARAALNYNTEQPKEKL